MATVIGPSGLSIHFAASGSGTPVLLLPGLGATIASWGGLLGRLAATHRCIAVDNRGSGGSDIPYAPFGMADMADDARAVLDHLGIQRAHVVGNSLGGMVAQAMALRHPGRVRSLVLAATSPGVASVPSHPSLAYHLLAARRADHAGRIRHLAAVFHGPATTVDHPERLTGVSPAQLGIPGGPGTRMQLRAALRWSGLWWLRRIAAPTLVLHGSHDRLVPPVNARLMAGLIPGARLRILARAGHFFISDAADEAGSAIAAFVGDVEGTTRATVQAGRRAALLPRLAPVAG